MLGGLAKKLVPPALAEGTLCRNFGSLSMEWKKMGGRVVVGWATISSFCNSASTRSSIALLFSSVSDSRCDFVLSKSSICCGGSTVLGENGDRNELLIRLKKPFLGDFSFPSTGSVSSIRIRFLLGGLYGASIKGREGEMYQPQRINGLLKSSIGFYYCLL